MDLTAQEKLLIQFTNLKEQEESLMELQNEDEDIDASLNSIRGEIKRIKPLLESEQRILRG